MKFVSFQYNYSDEIRAYGFALMTTEQWNDYSNKIKAGTSVSWNEVIYDKSPADFLELFEVSEIEKTDSDVLNRVFNLAKHFSLDCKVWGVFPFDHYIASDDDIVVDEW